MMVIWEKKFIREKLKSMFESSLGFLIPSTNRGPFDAH